MPPKGSRGGGRGRGTGDARSRSRTPAQANEPTALVKGLKALLLGLERRPDRRKRAEEMLQAEVPWLQFEFFKASDGKLDTIPESEVAPTWNTKRNALYGDYEDVFDKDKNLLYTKADFEDPGVDYYFSPGERGCAHSHYRMWQYAAEQTGPTLILEDDVQLKFERQSGGGMASGKTFLARLELGMQEATKKNAEVLYLGWAGYRDGHYKHHKAGRGKKNPIIRKAEYVWTTVAYVLWPSGAKKLLAAAKPLDQPVDNFMAWECREGRLASFILLDEHDSDSTWDGGIVAQADFANDSDIKKSDGGDQGHDPTQYLVNKTPKTPAAPVENGQVSASAGSSEADPITKPAEAATEAAGAKAEASAPAADAEVAADAPAEAAADAPAEAEAGAPAEAEADAPAEAAGDAPMAE